MIYTCLNKTELFFPFYTRRILQIRIIINVLYTSLFFWMFCLFFFDGVVDISQTTFATVLAIKMCSHEDTGSTFLTRAFTSQTMDFAVIVHPVVL